MAKKTTARSGYRPSDLTSAARSLATRGLPLLINPKHPWGVESSYSNSGVTAKRIVKTFASEGAARRFAEKWNDRATKTAGGFARVVRNDKKNPATRKNHHNEQAAIEKFREFHGEDPREIIEFETIHHYPGRTAALGDLKQLKIRIPREREVEGGRLVTLSNFGEGWLTQHPTMRQLYAEGGDQSLDLEEFGLSADDPNEIEYLGELTRCLYFTRKVHLGEDGGTANYDHKFGKAELGEHELGLSKTELIKVGYHVPDEQLIFMGGGYTIPAEGIDG